MSRPSARRKSGAVKTRRAELAPTRTADRTIYIGLLVIGGFAVLLAFLLTENWRAPTLAYVAFLAALINLFAIMAYRGKSMANWQQALARLPLRFVGYGSREGKPLDAAHGHAPVRRAILVSLLVSVVVLVGLSLILFPGLVS